MPPPEPHRHPRPRSPSFGRRKGPSETFAPHRPFRARETLSRRPDRRNPAPHPAGNRGSLGDTRLDAGSPWTAWWGRSLLRASLLGNPAIHAETPGNSLKHQWNQGPAGDRGAETRGKPAFRQGRNARNRPDAPRGRDRACSPLACAPRQRQADKPVVAGVIRAQQGRGRLAVKIELPRAARPRKARLPPWSGSLAPVSAREVSSRKSVPPMPRDRREPGPVPPPRPSGPR